MLNKSISVVIPSYNEVENLRILVPEICDVLENSVEDFEVIIVDDGSSDGTIALSFDSSRVRLLKFRRNFGQTAAMQAGIDNSKFELITFLDADGQNDPSDILPMINELIISDLDAVCGWRKFRRDTRMKRIVSVGARFLRKVLIKGVVHDSGCTLKVIRQSAAQELKLYGELHRFIPEILVMQGFTLGEMTVNHRPRRIGNSKYTWKRIVKGYLDMVGLWFWHRYSFRPLHALGVLSIIFFILGSASFLSAAVSYIFFGEIFTKFLPTIGIMFWLFSLQFLLSGLLADTLVKNNLQSQRARPYVIAEIIN
jgi:glycosyltransferase involved in cell wall biosynthesis